MPRRNREGQQVRKIWIPKEIKDAVREYCWRHRTKPSPFVGTIIQRVIDDPASFEGQPVPPAHGDNISVYVPDEVWDKAMSITQDLYGLSLSAFVRVGIVQALAEEGIPWDVTTIRPKNIVIPSRA